MNIKAIISDSDGTLVNTVSLVRYGQYEATMTYFKQHDLLPNSSPTYEEYEVVLNKSVGGSTRQTFEKTIRQLFSGRTDLNVDAIDFDEIDASLKPIQDKLAPTHVKAFPELTGTLSWIGKSGIKLAIFTSGNPHHIVRNIGVALGYEWLGDYATLYLNKEIDDRTKLQMFIKRLEQIFNIPAIAIVTCEDVKERTKPDPYGIELLLQELNVSTENALVFGDHVSDMQAAVNAHVPVRMGVTHGFGDREALLQAGATYVVDSLLEVPQLLAVNNISKLPLQSLSGEVIM